MARYIDADAFLEKFKSALENAQHYGLYNHAKITQYVMKSIENEPTADVAPKTETAREIFAEIEKAHDDCIEIGSRNVGFLKVNKFEWMLAELKKKYCGEVAPDTNDGRKKTNFDRIKEMTVDEMAVLLCKGSICIADDDRRCKPGKCENCLKEWLESEVAE